MNINVKSGIDKDPFAQSDRGGFGKNAGKGDSPRSLTRAYFANYDEIAWSPRVKSPGKTIYRPGRRSNCCGATMAVAGHTTMNYVCDNCGKPCDLKKI